LVPPLASVRLLRMSYSLFVPQALLPAGQSPDYRRVLGSVPLALQSTGGQFHTTFEEAARKQNIRCRAALRCVSFIQAHRALLTGQYAAILPSFAASEVDPARYAQIPLPLLKSYERILCLAWNPRLLRLRPALEKITAHLASTLAKS